MDECPLTRVKSLQNTPFSVWGSVCFVEIPSVRKITQTDSEEAREGVYHGVQLCVVGSHTVLVPPLPTRWVISM